MSQTCSRCENEKHEADFYSGDAYCKECRREYKKAWHATHPDRNYASPQGRAYYKRWREDHPENVKAYAARAREHIRERRRTDPAFREAERARSRQAYRRRATRDPAYLPPEQRTARKRFRSTRLQLKLLQRQRFGCAACRELLVNGFEMDHITPLAQGGTNDELNFQLLCGACNAKKGGKRQLSAEEQTV